MSLVESAAAFKEFEKSDNAYSMLDAQVSLMLAQRDELERQIACGEMLRAATEDESLLPSLVHECVMKAIVAVACSSRGGEEQACFALLEYCALVGGEEVEAFEDTIRSWVQSDEKPSSQSVQEWLEGLVVRASLSRDTVSLASVACVLARVLGHPSIEPAFELWLGPGSFEFIDEAVGAFVLSIVGRHNPARIRKGKEMKKVKWLVTVAAICSLALCLVGCGGVSQEAQQQQEAKDSGLSVSKTTDGIIEDIQSDFKATKDKILDEESKAKEVAGDSFDSYVAGKSAITDWYDSTNSSAKELFDRTNENAVAYYKLVAAGSNGKDYSDLKKEMTDFYRAVYEDEMTGFYRDIYTDAMKDMYDTYYAGVLQSSSGKVAYKTLSDECTEFYRAYSDAQSDLYRTYSDAQSDLYRDYSDVLSAFYSGDYDVDKALGGK